MNAKGVTTTTIEPHRLNQLLDAVLNIGADLELQGILRRIIEAAVSLVDARYGALGVLDEGGTYLSQFITAGIDNHTAAQIDHLPKGHGILGVLIRHPEPLRLPDLSRHPDSYGFPPNHPQMSGFLGVPILLRRQVFGNLYLTDKENGAEFTPADEAVVVSLASAAAIAIENARLHSRVREMTLSEDRERIARDLHDTVIQRLFATGLSLQAVTRVIQPEDAANRVHAAITDLDDTITQIRTSIFALEHTSTEGGLRAELVTMTRDAKRMLGFEPSLSLHGPLDSTVTKAQWADILAVVREALSNAARYAQATRVDVLASVENDIITVEVTDNGVGVDAEKHSGGHGIRNLAKRAHDLGGAMNVTNGKDGGTVVTWRVPRIH